MGYNRHNAIVATTFSAKHASAARALAVDIFGEDDVSPLMTARINGVVSFFVQPDGSKEGWDISDEGDDRRSRWADAVTDAGLWIDWADVQYGDDARETVVVAHSDEPERRALRDEANARLRPES